MHPLRQKGAPGPRGSQQQFCWQQPDQSLQTQAAACGRTSYECFQNSHPRRRQRVRDPESRSCMQCALACPGWWVGIEAPLRVYTQRCACAHTHTTPYLHTQSRLSGKACVEWWRAPSASMIPEPTPSCPRGPYVLCASTLPSSRCWLSVATLPGACMCIWVDSGRGYASVQCCNPYALYCHYCSCSYCFHAALLTCPPVKAAGAHGSERSSIHLQR